MTYEAIQDQSVPDCWRVEATGDEGECYVAVFSGPDSEERAERYAVMMNKPLLKTELHPAYVWDCDECGQENFARSVVLELSDEEKAEAEEDHGIDPDGVGFWSTYPDSVTCAACGKRFLSASMQDGEEDD